MNYIALIRKNDFVDLFKYGSLHVNKDTIRPFSCPVSQLASKECIFKDLIYFSNAFESTFEYVFIHYVNNNGRVNDVNIADVQGVYPLDYEAKTEFALTLDSRIDIKEPLWPSAVLDMQKKQTFDNCLNGIYNIWKIYGLKDSIYSVKQIISDSILREVVDEIFENRHPNGDLPIWVYVMRYERHSFYPNNTVGYFMDAFHSVFNFMQQREVDSSEIDGTNIMKFLYYCDQQPTEKKTFSNVYTALHKEPAVINIINKVKEIVPDFDLIKSATLFFIFRDRYKEEFRFERSYLETGLKSGYEFSIACYMLGFILGHEHTYDCLYSYLPLSIFKKSDTQVVIPTDIANNASLSVKEIRKGEDEIHLHSQDFTDNKEYVGKACSKPNCLEDGDVVPSTINVSGFAYSERPEIKIDMVHEQTSLFANEDSLLPEPIPMKKGARGKKITYAYNQEEYIRMLDNGYIQASLSSKTNKHKKK